MTNPIRSRRRPRALRLSLAAAGVVASLVLVGAAVGAPGVGSAATKAATTTKKSTVTTKVSGTKTSASGSGSIKSIAAVGKATTRVEVVSSADQYYVLYAKPVANSNWEIPVAIAKGKAGATVLTDGRQQLAANRLRVVAFPVAKPGDVDGDGVNDITEMGGAPSMNPLSAVKDLDPSDGVAIVPDRDTFEFLSYQGADVARDSYLADLEFVKFFIAKSNTTRPLVYVMNTETWRAHPPFAQSIGISSGRGRGVVGEMRGDVAYYPKAIGPDGTPGVYRFAFQPSDSYTFAEISVAYEAIANAMPFLANKLAYYPIQNGITSYEPEKALYATSRVPVILEAALIN